MECDASPYARVIFLTARKKIDGYLNRLRRNIDALDKGIEEAARRVRVRWETRTTIGLKACSEVMQQTKYLAVLYQKLEMGAKHQCDFMKMKWPLGCRLGRTKLSTIFLQVAFIRCDSVSCLPMGMICWTNSWATAKQTARRS